LSSPPDLTASQEDYLETIYQLERSDRVARVKDIAERLGVSTPSASGALKALKRRNLVNHRHYGHATLTPAGLEVAEEVLRRHELLVRFLDTVLQLPREQAEAEACVLEHAVNPETLKRLSVLLEFVETCPRGGRNWLARLDGNWEGFSCSGDCAACVAEIEVPDRPATPAPSVEGTVLSDQKPGWHGVVSRVEGKTDIRRRLMEMGVTPGCTVEVERVAPLGDPLELKIRGYHLSLRRDEAANVFVEGTTAGPASPGRRRLRRRRRGVEGR